MVISESPFARAIYLPAASVKAQIESRACGGTTAELPAEGPARRNIGPARRRGSWERVIPTSRFRFLDKITLKPKN
ncbi:hypothetical protein GCM10010994_41760 [Chelatococcus reniformis]|uniref:Uncharacterized protein n=1 Tax=Chelatococcus reniformis TaxID=1494448 RepID=A0A916UNK8_9HYPH|nr:hypothetical protein GCM10010994_41760 [Chelatococcus reniformis]